MGRLRGGDVKMVIWYFCLSLAAAAAWMIYARVTEDGFHTFVGGSITLGVLTVIFAITNRSLISEPASRIGFGPLGYLLILVAAVPIVLLVAGYVEVVNAWFGIKVPSELSEFAILHLSVPSLVTHFPLGMYFVWLRHKSNSLWPGVFAHACHNLGVCILDWVR
jgi:hypothetical protein